ncbi:MAG: hypothetical protein P8R42_23395 [Candidatus Binatia bacterium]|nr:hypothetical protein [Candidatus Binatia bacterium]
MPDTGRSCGSCDLCCTVLRVDELEKPARVSCEKLRADGDGCSIYATRPSICRTYKCAWLLGSLGDDDRPDRLGAVLDITLRGDRLWLEIHEESPGAFERSERLREIAQEYRPSAHVRVSDADRAAEPDRPFRILLADGIEQRVHGTRIDVFQNGALIDSTEIGWLRRTAARLLQAWRLRHAPEGALRRGDRGLAHPEREDERNDR